MRFVFAVTSVFSDDVFHSLVSCNPSLVSFTPVQSVGEGAVPNFAIKCLG